MRFILLSMVILTCISPVFAQDTSEDKIKEIPILYNMDTEEIQEIFERGQELGNRPNIFTKIGDSNSTNGAFLNPFGLGEQFYNLGDYDELQETIDFFLEESPRDGSPNSFVAYSMIAGEGFNSATVLDPFWADGRYCKPNATPVECEYQVVKPSVVVIMIGAGDARDSDVETYRANMERIIEISIEKGVIPVLTTFVVLPNIEGLGYEESIGMNLALIELADKYGIPLINLWAAVQELPDWGIGPDRTHLAQRTGDFCNFTGAEQELGGTLRNLLTLQALDELRRNVLDQQ